MVNAVLAAANARRIDVPINDSNVNRTLAASDAPLHTFKMDGNWTTRTAPVPDNLFKKIGMAQAPNAPRRL